MPLFYYRVAGFCLAIDCPIQGLESFVMVRPDSSVPFTSPRPQRLQLHEDHLIHDDEAWVGNAMRRVRCWFDGRGYEIDIDGIGRFSIAADGGEITLLQRESGADDGILVEALLGPALILALAIGGVFCLHASAVTLGNGVILFVGDSGAGKSTMASLLQNTGAGISRMTDDISPLVRREERFDLLSDFPQLKLVASQQNALLESSLAEITAIYQLDRVPLDKASIPRFSRQRLRGIDAFRVLVGQSVASRLFSPELLRIHTRQVAALCEAVPIYRLSYPSGVEHAAAVRNFLLSH